LEERIFQADVLRRLHALGSLVQGVGVVARYKGYRLHLVAIHHVLVDDGGSGIGGRHSENGIVVGSAEEVLGESVGNVDSSPRLKHWLRARRGVVRVRSDDVLDLLLID
jgi:hypothetical protein